MRPSVLFLLCTAFAASPAFADEDNWSIVREALFEGREIRDGSSFLQLEAPVRALDAAVVPVRIAVDPEHAPRIRTLWLVIDENPAPVAGVFHFFPKSGAPLLETRVRVNAYTDIRAIVEDEKGTLYMASRFVKAAGGCSAPALKDKEVAMARLGKMKFKLTTPFSVGKPAVAKLKIAHPNYTGLQIDQYTRQWIPPDYVTKVEVTFESEPVLEVEGDISLSEDPTFLFGFVPDRPGELQVRVVDSSERVFERSWTLGPAS